jgi:hypothetical protein
MSGPEHFIDVLRCTHGGDCSVHPEAGGLHNFEATAAQALSEVDKELRAGTSWRIVVDIVAERLGVQL